MKVCLEERHILLGSSQGHTILKRVKISTRYGLKVRECWEISVNKVPDFFFFFFFLFSRPRAGLATM